MVSILIIDDDREILDVFSEALAAAGFSVHLAGNGVEGLSQIETVQPDLVIVDVFMPEMDGIETILNIRKTKPDTRVIAMSGGGLSQNFKFLETSPEMGADLTLYKPVLPDELLQHVGGLLKGDTEQSCLAKSS